MNATNKVLSRQSITNKNNLHLLSLNDFYIRKILTKNTKSIIDSELMNLLDKVRNMFETMAN